MKFLIIPFLAITLFASCQSTTESENVDTVVATEDAKVEENKATYFFKVAMNHDGNNKSIAVGLDGKSIMEEGDEELTTKPLPKEEMDNLKAKFEANKAFFSENRPESENTVTISTFIDGKEVHMAIPRSESDGPKGEFFKSLVDIMKKYDK